VSEPFCPAYPKPHAKRPSAWWMFLGKRRSWLDGLYVRSYSMKMGEVHLPGVDLYMVNEPALVREVMVDRWADFPKHERLGDALRPLLGDSIFTTNGAVWKRQRELMEPSFEAARLKLAFSRMRAAADAMVQRLHALPDGTEHDVEVEMTHVTADIILRTILSVPIGSDEARRIFEAFSRYQALAPKLMMPSFFGLRWLKPWWRERESKAAAQEIRELLAQLIRPRHEAHARREVGPDDILASLLRATDPAGAPGFSFDELVDQVAMLFLAGHETSASALSWSLHLIAHAPAVQERLHAEARTHDAAGLADPSGLKDLAAARDVFRETLRLFPPVGFFARQCTHARRMRDKTMPAGASVLVAPWLIHRHRLLWAQPDAFVPERWASSADDESNSSVPPARESMRSAYLPFGMGPRVCIGAAFALQEATLILATLAQHWRFEPVAGHVPQPVGRLTIRSENGIRLRLFKRNART
jgi:cytochrome P450